eukprot:6188545-Pleurochrysis_carterae.AAC.2
MAKGSIGRAASRGAMAACARVKDAEDRAQVADECPALLILQQGHPYQRQRRRRRPTCWHQPPGVHYPRG